MLFAGRWAEEKGVRLLIDTWKKLGSLRLVMIGDGPMRPWVESQIEQYRLPIDLVGNVSRGQVAGYLSKAKLLIAPSICQEAGVPLVVIEAWCSGVPVIASSAGSLAEPISKGLIVGFREGSSEDLALQVDRLTKDSARADNLTSAGRAFYEQVHSPTRSLQLLIDHYVCHGAS